MGERREEEGSQTRELGRRPCWVSVGGFVAELGAGFKGCEVSDQMAWCCCRGVFYKPRGAACYWDEVASMKHVGTNTTIIKYGTEGRTRGLAVAPQGKEGCYFGTCLQAAHAFGVTYSLEVRTLSLNVLHCLCLTVLLKVCLANGFFPNPNKCFS